MRRLLVGDIQALTEDFSVSAGLVQKVHKIAVFKDVLDLRGGKQVLDVLRNSRGDTAPFAKAFPNLHTPGTNLASQQKVELVHEVPGRFALIPVLGNTVPHLILDHQHTQAFELFSQLLNIEADNAVVDIHIGSVVKNIQAAMHIQFQCRRNPLCLRLRLSLDLVIQIFQQRHILRSGVCNIGAVHDPHRTVNDRLFHWLQTVPAACRQFTERQDKVRFQRQRVIILAVIEVDIHRVYILRAGWRDFDDLAFQPVHQRKIFRLRVADQDIVLCIQEHTHDGTLCRKTLAAAGRT